MRTVIVSFLLVSAAAAFDISPVQPVIGANGVVNAASYISLGFGNYGIARGSLFLIFGNYIGPDTLVQASSFPLPSSDGLAQTRVHIDAPGYSKDAFVLYTSAKQVAAIMPSDAPEGDSILTLNYRNLASNAVTVHVVRSAFGMFALDQAGSGQAIAQNFVSATQTPLNTVLAAATPGQTVTLWGTGLGPVTGDESAGPLPGALPYLDALYVGGQPVNVRYAGRSGCCAGVDQIAFDVPANVSGCYVPIVAVTQGRASNTGTIAVSGSGGACDDPLSFRAADLATLQNTGRLRLGTFSLWNQTSAGAALGSNTLMASFISYTPQMLTMVPALVNPSAGTCYASQTPVTIQPSALPHGDAMNPGFAATVTGPISSLTAQWVSPGNYMASANSATLPAGQYVLSGSGGGDAGSLRTNFTVPAAVQWTNMTDFPASINIGQPLVFKWTGGAAGNYVAIQIGAVNATVSTSIICNLQATLGTFTVPDYLSRTLVQGQGTISVGTFATPTALTASGLDAATITAGQAVVLQPQFRTPAQ